MLNYEFTKSKIFKNINTLNHASCSSSVLVVFIIVTYFTAVLKYLKKGI